MDTDRRLWTPFLVFCMVLLLAFGAAGTGAYVATLVQPEFSVAAQDWNDAEDSVDSGQFNRPSPLGPQAQ